jgi:hypothetical protein
LLLIALLFSSLFLTLPLSTKVYTEVYTAIYTTVYAQGNDQNQTVPVVERELTIDRPYYRTVKIMVSYPYTNSHDITDITTIGASRYSHDSQPDSLVFLTDDIDVYTFTLHLAYVNATQRSIMITTWEGDRAPQGETWTENADDFIIHFKLTVMQQPTYPSAQEVANESFVQFENMYVQQLEENRRLLSEVQSSNNLISIMMILVVVVSVLALVLAGFGYRYRRQIPSQEAET